MINLTTNQTIAVCSTFTVIAVGTTVGAIHLEKRRKEYLRQVEIMRKRAAHKPINREEFEAQIKAGRDVFGSTSEDPEDVVITQVIKDRVDVVTPQSIDQLGSRFALTKAHRYAIYSDVSVIRPGEFDYVALEYWPEDMYFLYNGFPTPQADVEGLFGSDFAQEILMLGIGKEMQLLIYSNVKIDGSNNFIKILLTFHEGRIPTEVVSAIEDDDIRYDPDDPIYAEDDDDDEEEGDIDQADEDAIQEIMDAEEIEAAGERYFNHEGEIGIDPVGELDEMEVIDGWETVEWSYRLDTGFIYDENDALLSEEEIVEWLSLPVVQTLLSHNILTLFPDRTVYVKNGKLKLMYEITIK